MLSQGKSLGGKQTPRKVLKHLSCIIIIATIAEDWESELVCKMGLFNNWQLLAST